MKVNDKDLFQRVKYAPVYRGYFKKKKNSFRRRSYSYNGFSELATVEFGFYVVKKDMTGWKKVWDPALFVHKTIRLTIPKGAIVYVPVENNGTITKGSIRTKKGERKYVTIFPKKLRASEAISHGSGNSIHRNSFKYEKGKKVKPHFFSTDYDECSGGIHFFLTKAAADAWAG